MRNVIIVLGTLSLIFFFTTLKYEEISFFIVSIWKISLLFGFSLKTMLSGGFENKIMENKGYTELSFLSGIKILFSET